ncbi:MAG TPA: carboxypeptidase-like regulatory domain-containing protein [Chitinispirillaceae bacterium]|nr:carboxypeptidase-like regulatory domain-containing protein [Chitinispirillaceae bacterium]
MKRVLLILICLYLFSLYLCTGKIAGTETTNGDEMTITACANGIQGTAPSGTEIHLFSDEYYPYNDSGYTRSITVSDAGTYQFLNLESGNYNILFTYATSDTSVFVQRISVEASDHSDTDTVTFSITGTLKGTLIDTLSKPVRGAYAYIKGSPYYATTNDLGEYVLAKIPGGRYTLEFKLTNSNSTWMTKSPVSVSVGVTSGKVTEIEPVTYK